MPLVDAVRLPVPRFSRLAVASGFDASDQERVRRHGYITGMHFMHSQFTELAHRTGTISAFDCTSPPRFDNAALLRNL